MTLSTHEMLAMFGGVEDDQKYSRLVDLFDDDAVYYDPFFGPQVGKAAITDFMKHMEEVVPASGARFANWAVTAGDNCGFTQWQMVATNRDGHEVWVPGESLYRLRNGKVFGVVDYVDPVAYAKLRGDSARHPDFLAGGGSLPDPRTPTGQAADVLTAYINGLGRAGRWAGTATLLDVAGEADIGWAQWTFHSEHGDFAGWSLLNSAGHIRDLFDTVSAAQLAQIPTRGTS